MNYINLLKFSGIYSGEDHIQHFKRLIIIQRPYAKRGRLPSLLTEEDKFVRLKQYMKKWHIKQKEQFRQLSKEDQLKFIEKRRIYNNDLINRRKTGAYIQKCKRSKFRQEMINKYRHMNDRNKGQSRFTNNPNAIKVRRPSKFNDKGKTLRIGEIQQHKPYAHLLDSIVVFNINRSKLSFAQQKAYQKEKYEQRQIKRKIDNKLEKIKLRSTKFENMSDMSEERLSSQVSQRDSMQELSEILKESDDSEKSQSKSQSSSSSSSRSSKSSS